MSTVMQHRFVRHGLFWAAMLAFSLLMQLPAHWGNGAKLYVSGLFFNQLPASLLATYPLLYWLLPRLMRQRQFFAFLPLLAAWGAACALLTMLTVMCFDFVIMPGLFHARPDPAFHRGSYWALNYTFFITMLTAGIAVTVKIARQWETQRCQRQQLRQQRLRTELQLLKAQLQPAFLFGTLRLLQRLTAAKAPESPEAVLHLAELLRYMLYESPHDSVPLADEVAMMRRYVALEQLRLGRRVDVSLNFSGAFANYVIEPLLLLPFLENAFRHGTAPALDCAWISIDLVVRHHWLELKVINSQLPGAAAWTAGAGLRRVRQRLEHHYAGRYQLHLVPEPDTFLVIMHLPLAARAQPVPGRPQQTAPVTTLQPQLP
ncbi:histidine kinase [Microvirga sp. STR05]|uniref:Histidine kinase n=1 Tax=Hymenobacter duratus TaxID=2771356 RepID=A0ABR8JP94_9BACT|nr:histidine kinase [Hymenobacter duratus]MBD2717265.1 histidine kinase [Hymenobacter duratus]MBR7952185.1 histidine kinase [Microvirga sp. STR05]